MIRTSIKLADGSAGWRIITQVQHARMSAELARKCSREFSGARFASRATQEEFTEEVFQAIAHHDDGWLQWDSAPRIDPTDGKPLSFRELPLEESFPNWNGSIESAAQVGPLAGWLVASHFRALLQATTKAGDPSRIERWVAAIDANRAKWIEQWQSNCPESHTLELAESALAWLQTFDVISLWLCSVGGSNEAGSAPYPIEFEPSLKTQLTKAAVPGGVTSLGVQSRTEEMGVDSVIDVVLDPWLFSALSLEVQATSQVVPASGYGSAEALLAAGQTRQIHWRLSAGQ